MSGLQSAGGISPLTDVAASRDLDISDMGDILNVTATATLTIPARLPIGFNCLVMANTGATVTIAAGAGITIVDPYSRATLSNDGECCTVFMRTLTQAVLL